MRIYIIGQAVGLVTLYFFIFFIAGTIKKNNSIVDIGWGLGFVITAWFTLFISRSFFCIQYNNNSRSHDMGHEAVYPYYEEESRKRRGLQICCMEKGVGQMGNPESLPSGIYASGTFHAHGSKSIHTPEQHGVI